jgi:hypothetical protein
MTVDIVKRRMNPVQRMHVCFVTLYRYPECCNWCQKWGNGRDWMIPLKRGDGGGTKPAGDDGASVGKAKRGNDTAREGLKAYMPRSRQDKQTWKPRQFRQQEAAASLREFREDIRGHVETDLEGLRSCGKWTTACQLSSMAYPEKSTSGPEGTEAKVDAFERCSDKMETTDLEINPEAVEIVLERQEHSKTWTLSVVGGPKQGVTSECKSPTTGWPH